jgi:hypothetical protein
MVSCLQIFLLIFCMGFSLLTCVLHTRPSHSQVYQYNSISNISRGYKLRNCSLHNPPSPPYSIASCLVCPDVLPSALFSKVLNVQLYLLKRNRHSNHVMRCTNEIRSCSPCITDSLHSPRDTPVIVTLVARLLLSSFAQKHCACEQGVFTSRTRLFTLKHYFITKPFAVVPEFAGFVHRLFFYSKGEAVRFSGSLSTFTRLCGVTFTKIVLNILLLVSFYLIVWSSILNLER